MRKRVQLTPRGKYAVKAMIELANNKSEKPLALTEIAKKTDISLSYLEQLIAALRKHALVKSYRGPGGGYVINKDLKEINIAKILVATEDSTPAKRSPTSTKKTKGNIDQDLWSHVEQILYASLRSITLDDIVNDNLKNHLPSAKVFDLLR